LRSCQNATKQTVAVRIVGSCSRYLHYLHISYTIFMQLLVRNGCEVSKKRDGWDLKIRSSAIIFCAQSLYSNLSTCLNHTCMIFTLSSGRSSEITAFDFLVMLRPAVSFCKLIWPLGSLRNKGGIAGRHAQMKLV